jgi:hypothetical protein
MTLQWIMIPITLAGLIFFIRFTVKAEDDDSLGWMVLRMLTGLGMGVICLIGLLSTIIELKIIDL